MNESTPSQQILTLTILSLTIILYFLQPFQFFSSSSGQIGSLVGAIFSLLCIIKYKNVLLVKIFQRPKHGIGKLRDYLILTALIIAVNLADRIGGIEATRFYTGFCLTLSVIIFSYMLIIGFSSNVNVRN